MFCGHCGAQNPDQNRFCVECGSRLKVPLDETGMAITDKVSARLAGFEGLPEPTVEWPDDLPREVIGKNGSRMVLVPAGFFWMGAKKQKKDERPYRLVYIDSFYIDVHPVTNQQFATFLASSKHKAPGHRRDKSDDKWALRPVTRVSWHDASAYAKWAFKRLPTEAEWEKSARGIDGRTWPWGNEEPNDTLAELAKDQGPPEPIGSHRAGVSPYGVEDMAGGVWEWCADQYDQFFYPRSPPRNPRCDDGDPRYRVARGGAVTYSAFTARCNYRGWNVPHMRSAVYGFRCAVDANRYRRSDGKA
jgi:formylglycine-generating enzyme required for sulfatase activity